MYLLCFDVVQMSSGQCNLSAVEPFTFYLFSWVQFSNYFFRKYYSKGTKIKVFKALNITISSIVAHFISNVRSLECWEILISPATFPPVTSVSALTSTTVSLSITAKQRRLCELK